MPLPIAHACVGASIATALGPGSRRKPDSRMLVVAAALLAIVPDLDFFFVWVLRMGPGWHRGFTHSVAFSAVVASLAAFAFRGEWRKAFLTLWAAVMSHCVLDTLTSKLAPGAELFWPFYSRRYSAGFVDYFDFSIKVRGALEFLVLVLKISAIEALIFIPLFLMVRSIVRRVRTYNIQEGAIEHQEIG